MSIQRVPNRNSVVICGATEKTQLVILTYTVVVQSNKNCVSDWFFVASLQLQNTHQNWLHPDNTWATVFWWRSAICWSCCNSSTYHGAHGRREWIWRKKWPTSRVWGRGEICFWICFKVIVCIVNVISWSYIPAQKLLGHLKKTNHPWDVMKWFSTRHSDIASMQVH